MFFLLTTHRAAISTLDLAPDFSNFTAVKNKQTLSQRWSYGKNKIYNL